MKRERSKHNGRESKRTTRRSFLKLVAAGSAALMGGVAVPVAGAATTPAKRKAAAASASRAAATFTPAMRREIANQKNYVARVLKALRGYSLAPGSDPGFTFRPLRPSRRRAR